MQQVDIEMEQAKIKQEMAEELSTRQLKNDYTDWLTELNANTHNERMALIHKRGLFKEYQEGYAAGVEFATRKALENYRLFEAIRKAQQ